MAEDWFRDDFQVIVIPFLVPGMVIDDISPSAKSYPE